MAKIRAKSGFMVLMVCVFVLTGCDRGRDEKASAAYAKRVEDTDRRSAEYERQLSVAAEHQRKSEEQIKRWDALLEKWEKEQQRFDVLLDKWERLTTSIEQKQAHTGS